MASAFAVSKRAKCCWEKINVMATWPSNNTLAHVHISVWVFAMQREVIKCVRLFLSILLLLLLYKNRRSNVARTLQGVLHYARGDCIASLASVCVCGVYIPHHSHVKFNRGHAIERERERKNNNNSYSLHLRRILWWFCCARFCSSSNNINKTL